MARASGGGCGFCLGDGVSVVGAASNEGRIDSEVDGRPSACSVTWITNPFVFPGGCSISNSGNPAGGLVV